MLLNPKRSCLRLLFFPYAFRYEPHTYNQLYAGKRHIHRVSAALAGGRCLARLARSQDPKLRYSAMPTIEASSSLACEQTGILRQNCCDGSVSCQWWLDVFWIDFNLVGARARQLEILH